MPKIVWLVVKTNDRTEALKIGRAALRSRLAGCFDILPRLLGQYYWPPRKNKLQTSSGPNLVLETLPKFVLPLKKLVKKKHSDRLPFIGRWELKMEPEFVNWLKGELR